MHPIRRLPVPLFGLASLAAAAFVLAAPAAQAQRPSLLDQSQQNALPETLHIPTRKEAPGSVHQGDWGVFNREDGTAAGWGPVARYGVARWAEDWQALRDPKQRSDPFDPLKYIPLNPGGQVYLTLSLDERLRNWFETDPFLGTQKPRDSGRMILRGLYGADLHLGEHVRVYGELVSGDAGGWGGYGYTGSYRKRLDLQQGFVELKDRLLGAQTGVILGRQSFLDAPSYILFARETPNLPLSWDGGRAYAFWRRFRLDLFDFVQTNTTPRGIFRDNQNWSARLFGATASWAVPDFTFLGQPGHVFLDVNYLGYLLGGTPAAIATASYGATQAGSTLRHTVSPRLWGKAGPIAFSLGASWQTGEFRQARSPLVRDVSALALNGFAGWRFGRLPAKPLIGLQADLYSGGDDRRRTGSIGTYIAPYNPQTSYTDTTTYIAPSNLIDLTPTFELSPTGWSLLRLRVPMFWRESVHDAVYGSGRIYPWRAGFRDAYIGTAPQLNLALRLSRHLTWNNDFARFLVSDGLRRAGGSDGTYYQSTFDFRF